MMIKRLRLLGNQKDFHFKKADNLHLYFMRTYLHNFFSFSLQAFLKLKTKTKICKYHLSFGII